MPLVRKVPENSSSLGDQIAQRNIVDHTHILMVTIQKAHRGAAVYNATPCCAECVATAFMFFSLIARLQQST